MITNTGQFALL